MPTYIDGFEIDAVLNEDRSVECDITDHPVEKGVSITDHARVRPRMITMDCLVSDTPVGALADRRGIELETSQGGAALSSGPTGDFVPSDVARNWLESLQRARKTVLVSTEWTRANGSLGYIAYDNMMIQSIGETITPDTGDSATFKVTFKQVVFVTNNRTTVQVAVPRAKKKNDKGNKPNKDATTPERRKSWAATSYDAGASFYKDIGGVSGLLGF